MFSHFAIHKTNKVVVNTDFLLKNERDLLNTKKGKRIANLNL